MVNRSVEEIDAQIAELRKERKHAAARERKAEMDARQAVSCKIGELVLSLYPDGWRSIDPEKLAQALYLNAGGCTREYFDKKPKTLEKTLNKWKKFSYKPAVSPSVAEKD